MRRVLFLSASVLALQAANASAQTIDLGEVGATGATTDSSGEKPGTAAALAPTQSSLTAGEPQTILNQRFLRDIASPMSDYLAVAEFAPSSSNSAPNGMGLSSKNGTVRGFQDGQYNVTFDGIPFGDPSAFGHATTSFFPAPVLDHVIVDRGPGTASTVGNATFGGTVSLFSETPSQDFGGRIEGAVGSGNSYETGGVANTGAIAETGGTTVLMNYDHLTSDGLLQEAGFHRENGMIKLQQPIGAHTVVTFVSNYSDLKWNTFTQQTKAMVEKYGLNYSGLNDDPDSQEYYNYNRDHRRADFEYVGIQSDFDFIRFDNKLYTYSLDDHASGGADQSGATPNSALLKSGVPGADVIGIYRSWGDIAKFEKDFGSGFSDTTVRFGVWAEHSRYSQFEQSVDLSTGQTAAFIPYKALGSIIENNLAVSDTDQPFIEFEWRPLPGLTITPGFKHIDFSRTFTGVQSFATYNSSGDYSANLGSTEVNYRIAPKLSVYGQWAMGFQAPQVSVLQTSAASANRVSPQQTINYQTGVVYKDDRLTADLDGYYINFRNKVSSDLETVNGLSNQTVYFNQGGVIYKGIEAEATYVLGSGFAVTGNGSINSAAVKATGLQIANAPTSTAAFGPLYDQDAFFGSILTKYVGHRFAGTGELANGNPNVRLPAYHFTDLVVGYRIDHLLKAQFMVNDLFDLHSKTEGSGALTNPTYYYLPGRNYMAQVTMDF